MVSEQLKGLPLQVGPEMKNGGMGSQKFMVKGGVVALLEVSFAEKKAKGRQWPADSC